MSKYRKTMSEVLAEMSEGFSKKQIKMAIGVASDPRYKGGNYTGAFKAIEKIKKGLASHPQVAAVLKRQNTSFDPEIAEAGHDDVASAKNQVKVAMSALQKMETELGKLGDEDSLPTWWTNKVAIAVDKLDGMADYLDTQVEQVELDEASIDMLDHDRTDPDFQDLIKKLKLKAKDLKGDDGTTVTGNARDIEKMLSTMYGNDWKDMYKRKGQKYIDIDEQMDEEMRVFRVTSGKLQGNVHAKDEKEAEKIFRKKGAKGKITITDRGPVSKRIRRNVRNEFELDEVIETVVESWELDEMKMDDPKLLKIFDKLKKGSTVKIKIDSSISKGKDYREFTVTAKNIVGKGKRFEQEKITLKSKDNPTGVKHFLYNRDGKVTLAIGDMGASIADIKENNMSAYTAAITKGVK